MVSTLPFHHPNWNDCHLGIRLLTVCLHTAASDTKRNLNTLPPCLNLFLGKRPKCSAWSVMFYLTGPCYTLSPHLNLNLMPWTLSVMLLSRRLFFFFFLIPMINQICPCCQAFAHAVPCVWTPLFPIPSHLVNSCSFFTCQLNHHFLFMYHFVTILLSLGTRSGQDFVFIWLTIWLTVSVFPAPNTKPGSSGMSKSLLAK